MKFTADTNVLMRLILADDEAQGQAALESMDGADLVAISVPALCEQEDRRAVGRQGIGAKCP